MVALVVTTSAKTYASNTTCDTSVSVSSGTNYTNQQLADMLNMYQLADVGFASDLPVIFN